MNINELDINNQNQLLAELNSQEWVLLNEVNSLEGTIEHKEREVMQREIPLKFKEIYKAYAELSKYNLEALKRGVFLLWYSVSEPFWLTGIDQLNQETDNIIIHTLNLRLRDNSTDFELDWMLDYYFSWDYIFDRFEKYSDFHNRFLQKTIGELPLNIDKSIFKNRGQLGIYWNSIYSSKVF